VPTAGALTVAEVQKLFVHRLGLRIGPETAAYLLRRLEREGPAPAIPVMGANARTGVAVRVFVETSQVTAGLTS
jgi:hypothetical protein